MINLLKKFILKGKKVQWTETRHLKVGMKIAVTQDSSSPTPGHSEPREESRHSDAASLRFARSFARAQDDGKVGSDTNLAFETITSIKPLGRQQVYDIEIEGTHNFVANQILAHNTYITGAFYDSNNSAGGSGQVLSTTATGTDWVDASGVGTDDQTLAEVYAEADNTVQLTATNGDIRFYNDESAEMLFLDESTGNLGIGTTDPQYKLEVTGTAQFDDQVNFADGTTYYVDVTGNAKFLDIIAADTGNPGITVGDGSIGFMKIGSSTIRDNSTAFLGFDPDTDGTSELVITNTGNLGIGITAPTSALHVYGSSGTFFDVDDDGTSLFSITDTAITSALPHQFTASGDTSMAYDLILTNQTSSKIESYGPFTIETGESFENNNLTLKTYGTGALVVDAGGGSEFTRSGNTVATFNRTTSDGTIISLQQAGSEEGTISVSTTTVSYNAFTGSHYAWTDQNIETGYLVSLTNQNKRLHNNPLSEILYGIKTTTQVNDPKVMGAYLSILEPSKIKDEHNPHLVMAVGNADIWVADTGQDIQPGDNLISSSLPGHAQKDNFTYPVSHVVARAAQSVNWLNIKTTINDVKHTKISVFFENQTINRQINDLLTLNQEGQVTNWLQQDNQKEQQQNNRLEQLNYSINSLAQNLSTNFQTGLTVISHLKVRNLMVEEKLISPIAYIEDLEVKNLVAENIKAPQISQIEKDLQDLKEKYSTASAILQDRSSASGRSVAEDSPEVRSDINLQILDDLQINNTLITNIINSNICQAEDSSASGALPSVDSPEVAEAITTCDDTLFLQPLANAPINLLAGLMTLTPDGQVIINGDLAVTGKVLASKIEALESNLENLTSQTATISALTTNQLIISTKDTSSASGALPSVDSPKVGSVTTTATSSTSVATATIEAGDTEITISNTNVTQDTYIYLTPTSNTSNQTLFIKSKEKGKFTIAIPQAVNHNITFNYWLIQTLPLQP